MAAILTKQRPFAVDLPTMRATGHRARDLTSQTRFEVTAPLRRPWPGLNNGAASSQIMSIPSPRFAIKPTTLLLIFGAGLWAGCAPAIAEAPFPSRADTVMPGNLLGPFDGRVVDAANGKPIAGAIVQ